MSFSKLTRGKEKMSVIKPIVLCVLFSALVTFIVVCVISLVFMLLESIAKNAVGPLSVAAAAIGCLAGGYICAGIIGKNQIISGGIIGLINFFIIYFISCFGAEFRFGSDALIKLFIFIAAGCCGGYLGRNKRYCGKRRK